jgi:hypothetical protein
MPARPPWPLRRPGDRRHRPRRGRHDLHPVRERRLARGRRSGSVSAQVGPTHPAQPVLTGQTGRAATSAAPMSLAELCARNRPTQQPVGHRGQLAAHGAPQTTRPVTPRRRVLQRRRPDGVQRPEAVPHRPSPMSAQQPAGRFPGAPPASTARTGTRAKRRPWRPARCPSATGSTSSSLSRRRNSDALR